MKNIIRIYLLACLALLSFAACSEANEYLFGAKEPYVKFSTLAENDGIFTPEAQKGSVLIGSNATWKVVSLSDWLSCLTPEGEFDDTIKVQFPKNVGDTRKAKLVVCNTVGSEKTDTLELTQQCAESFIPDGYSIKIKSETLSSTLQGDNYVEVPFAVTSSTAWRIFTKPVDSWTTVVTKKGTEDGPGSIIVSRNPTINERKMFVYAQSVTYPSLKDSVEVKQGGHSFIMKITAPETKKILLDESASQFTFTVESDGKWVVEDLPSWLSMEKTQYEGTANVVVKASATSSSRSAKLILKSLIKTEMEDVLTVEQKVIADGQEKDSLALMAIYNSTNGAKWVYPWKVGMPLNEVNYPGVFFTMVDGQKRVVDLSLADFNLEGTLPNEIGWLTQLTKLKLQRNKLTGPLPASMNKLVNLTHIYLTSCRFSGEFPDISALKKLVWLDADFNRFEGEFPASFSLLPKLTTLKFKYNNLDINSCVPKRFGSWRLGLYINPQRTVVNDKSSDYNLKDCQ